jgi:hypothetical protein
MGTGIIKIFFYPYKMLSNFFLGNSPAPRALLSIKIDANFCF